MPIFCKKNANISKIKKTLVLKGIFSKTIPPPPPTHTHTHTSKGTPNKPAQIRVNVRLLPNLVRSCLCIKKMCKISFYEDFAFHKMLFPKCFGTLLNSYHLVLLQQESCYWNILSVTHWRQLLSTL